MKRFIAALLLAGTTSTAAGQDLLITNAALLSEDASGFSASATRDILVENGRIARIGDSIRPRADMAVIDAAGKPVTPAFFAGISATGIAEVNGVAESVDSRLRDLFTGLMHPEFDVRPAFNPSASAIPVTRVEGFGFTLLAPSFGDRSVHGSGGIVRLDGGYDSFEGKTTVFVSVTGGSADALGGSRAAHWMLLEAAFAELETEVDDLQFLTPMGQQTLLDAKRNGIFVFAAHRASDIRQVLKFAARHDLDVVIQGAREAWLVRDELAAAKVPVAINALDNLPADFDSIGARLDNAALLREAGVPVMFTSGETPNARKNRQLAGVAVANGMPYSDAIAALTSVPAAAFGAEARTIERGALADLVIWSGDPLEVTTWAEQVILGGSPDSMVSRQTQLRDRYLPRQAPMGRGYVKP